MGELLLAQAIPTRAQFPIWNDDLSIRQSRNIPALSCCSCGDRMRCKFCAQSRIGGKASAAQNQGGVDFVRKDQSVVLRHQHLQSAHLGFC